MGSNIKEDCNRQYHESYLVTIEKIGDTGVKKPRLWLKSEETDVIFAFLYELCQNQVSLNAFSNKIVYTFYL